MMNEMVLIDIETQSFEIESGIYEVAALAVKNGEIIDKLYLGKIEDESMIHMGYGSGYYNISEDEKSIKKFKEFINKYNYPMVAHNGSFDRKFLVAYEWLDEDYPFYDSIRAIKYKNSKLFSYSIAHIKDYLALEEEQIHMAMSDVEMLYKILKEFNPDIWIPIGQKVRGKSSNKYKYYKPCYMDTLNNDYEIVKDLFVGKNIVFTGKGEYTRDKLMELAKKCGADISSNNITKKTNLLVVGDKPGSKLEKAKELGIEIMDMSDFYDMVEGIELDDTQKAEINMELIRREKKDDTIVVESDKLKGQIISLIPMKVSYAVKASKIIEKHGGKSLNTLREKETTLLVYQPYGEDMASVKRARDKGIKTITLGAFNRYIVELEEQLKGKQSMLQERINDLDSGILEYIDDKVHVTGFLSEERLNDYYQNGKQCFFSKGIYRKMDLYWGGIKDNALFILIKDGNEVNRFQFEVLKKDTVQLRTKRELKPREASKYKTDYKTKSKTYTIRKCKYSGVYNLISKESILDDDNNRSSVEDNKIFEKLEDLKVYLEQLFENKIQINIDDI